MATQPINAFYSRTSTDHQQTAQTDAVPTAVCVPCSIDSPVDEPVPLAEAHVVKVWKPPHRTTGTGRSRNQTQPISNNPQPIEVAAFSLEDPLHKKRRRFVRRAARMHRGAVGGAVVGFIFLGPLGLSIGFASGAAVAYGASKVGEKRKDRRFARRVAHARSAA